MSMRSEIEKFKNLVSTRYYDAEFRETEQRGSMLVEFRAFLTRAVIHFEPVPEPRRWADRPRCGGSVLFPDNIEEHYFGYAEKVFNDVVMAIEKDLNNGR